MADNVAITAGSGTTVAADEIVDGTLGTVKAQFVKVMDGTLDSTNKWKINTDGSASFVGNIASGATDSGNPVKVGGVYNSTLPTFTNGQRGDLQLNSRGHLLSAIIGELFAASTATLSTTASPPTTVTSNTAGIVIDTSQAGNVTVGITGTFTGSPIVAFEVSIDNGTTWFPWAGVRGELPGVAGTQTTLIAGTTEIWEFAMPGPSLMRVRLTTAPSTNTVSVGLVPSGFLYDPLPSVAQATGQGRTLQFASISAASSGNNTLVSAAGTGLKIKLVSYVLVADGTVTATFQSGAGGTGLSGAMALIANSGVSAMGQPSSHLMETAAATLLNLSLSAAVGVRGHLSYFTEK